MKGIRPAFVFSRKMLTKRDLRYNFWLIHFTSLLGIFPAFLDRDTGKVIVKENDFWTRLRSKCIQLVQLSYTTFGVCRVIYFTSINPTWHTFAHILDSTEWMNKTNRPLKEGYIALQAESQPIDFHKIELLNLVGCTDQKAKNYKDYYLKSDNSQCKY